MKLELAIFLIFGGLALVVYFTVCWRRRTRPHLQEALLLLFSALSLAGASKVIEFPFQAHGEGGQRLIESDVPTGGALIGGALCLVWFAIEAIVNLVLEVLKRSGGNSD